MINALILISELPRKRQRLLKLQRQLLRSPHLPKEQRWGTLPGWKLGIYCHWHSFRDKMITVFSRLCKFQEIISTFSPPFYIAARKNWSKGSQGPERWSPCTGWTWPTPLTMKAINKKKRRKKYLDILKLKHWIE